MQQGKVIFSNEERAILAAFLARVGKQNATPGAASSPVDAGETGPSSHGPAEPSGNIGFSQVVKEATEALKEFLGPNAADQIPDFGKVGHFSKIVFLLLKFWFCRVSTTT